MCKVFLFVFVSYLFLEKIYESIPLSFDKPIMFPTFYLSKESKKILSFAPLFYS
jgi:hypothetical protein